VSPEDTQLDVMQLEHIEGNPISFTSFAKSDPVLVDVDDPHAERTVPSKPAHPSPTKIALSLMI
jgi:hypothetical protein